MSEALIASKVDPFTAGRGHVFFIDPLESRSIAYSKHLSPPKCTITELLMSLLGGRHCCSM